MEVLNRNKNTEQHGYCSKCQGIGLYWDMGQIQKKCDQCNGKGYHVTEAQIAKFKEMDKASEALERQKAKVIKRQQKWAQYAEQRKNKEKILQAMNTAALSAINTE